MNNNQKQLIEIIGVIGIVVSLFFVGMQLYFETEVALSEQYASRAESMKSDLRARLESDDWMSAQERAWENGERPAWWNEDYENQSTIAGFSPREVWATIYNIQLGVYQADNLYFQYQKGLLDEELWIDVRKTVSDLMQNSYVREVYLDTTSYLPIHDVLKTIANE